MSYGIWSTVSKSFVFGIIEKTPGDAKDRLFDKIGKESYKYRFETRQIPKDTLEKMQDSKRSYRCGHPGRYGYEIKGDSFSSAYGDPLDYVPFKGHKCIGAYVTLHGLLTENVKHTEIERAKSRLERQARATIMRQGLKWSDYDFRVEWSVHYEVNGENIITVGWKVYIPEKETELWTDDKKYTKNG